MTKGEELHLELSRSVAILEIRVDFARKETERVDADRAKSFDVLMDVGRRLAVVEDNLKELKRLSDERDRREWSVKLALFTSLVTLAINLGLIYMGLKK